jgi:tetratricopeptide (TPR) repeat protein
MSSIQFFVWSNDYAETLYWLVILLTIAALAVNWKKTDITDLAFLMATGFVSFIATRYSFFFMAAALPVIARCFSRERLRNFSRVAIPAIALFPGLFFSWGERNNFESLKSGVKIDNYLCPVKAADFIISNDIRGNMYNVYEWGGYLIWRLAPERKVFIDPRDIFEEPARESTLMDRANADGSLGNPTWKAIVHARGIEYMVIHIAQMTGKVIPLFFAVMQDTDWLPVFADINAVIFVRNSPLNEQVIGKFSIPKDYLMNALIMLYERLVDSNPAEINLFITQGDLYMSQARVTKAIEAYEKAVEIAPFNATAREKLDLLRRGIH